MAKGPKLEAENGSHAWAEPKGRANIERNSQPHDGFSSSEQAQKSAKNSGARKRGNLDNTPRVHAEAN